MISMCHISATNRSETEEDYQAMISSKIFNAMKFHGLIRKICNGYDSVIAVDVVGKMIEALRNFALIRGEEHDSLHKHLETSEHRF